MLLSMTGFGTATYENDKIKIDVEIKSLNSKNFDLKLKFYDLPADKEILLRKKLSESLKRGKIECKVEWKLKENAAKYEIKKDVFKEYFAQVKEITEELGEKPVDIYNLFIRFPDLLEAKETDLEQYWFVFEDTILEAAEKLTEFRKQEGAATEKDISEKLLTIEKLLPEIEIYESQRNENFRKKLKEAFLNSDIQPDKDRFEQEIIFYLDKYDINEEKQRLKNHIDYFKEVLKGDETEKGKKLTFIAQEMNREITTLGNKSFHFEIQKIVVRMKDNLEKIKEQLANVI